MDKTCPNCGEEVVKSVVEEPRAKDALVEEQLPEARITTNGGHPAVELPNGERLTLKLFINQRKEESTGESLDYETEVCSDDFSWWQLICDGEVEVDIMPQVGWHDVSEGEQFDPADYDNVRDALREAPAGYGVESVIDYFDPVAGGGHGGRSDG